MPEFECWEMQIPNPMIASRDDFLADEAASEDSWLMHTGNTPEKRSQPYRTSASGTPQPPPRRSHPFLPALKDISWKSEMQCCVVCWNPWSPSVWLPIKLRSKPLTPSCYSCETQKTSPFTAGTHVLNNNIGRG